MKTDKIIMVVIALTVVIGIILVMRRFKDINKTIEATK